MSVVVSLVDKLGFVKVHIGFHGLAEEYQVWIG